MKTRLIAFSIMSVLTTDTWALGALSRACQFSTIPNVLKAAAGNFFAGIGGDPYAKELASKPTSEQANYWVMESLTVDWARARYYLYAQNNHFAINPHPESNYYNQWQWAGAAHSRQWTAETVSEALRADPRFSPWFANRKFLFSARAGSHKIIEKLGTTVKSRAVVGNHYAYDPVSQVPIKMSDTVAFDCNLGSWGFGNGIFDR